MHTTHIIYQLEFLSILLEISSGNTFMWPIAPQLATVLLPAVRRPPHSLEY